MSSAPIQILGAGLTGMSAGHHLQHGFEIHERLPHAGGHAITVEQQGYRFDRTGHLLHLRDAAMRTWIEGLFDGQLRFVQRKSRVFSHGVYTRYPYQANTFGLPPQVAYECLTGYLEARAREAETPEPADFEQFCLKYFGRGFSEHFMIPYNQKLWGVHPREITAAWCSRFVPRPKLEDVIAGAVGLNDRELGYNIDFLYPARGIGELSRLLAAGLGAAIRLGHAPRAIDWRKRKLLFDDGEVPYQVLISSAPLDQLVPILLDAPAEVTRAAERLLCMPLLYLDVALERPCGVDMHWAYVPEPRYPFYRVGCYSNFSAQMAPPGKANLYVELAARVAPDVDALRSEVIAGLCEMQIIERPADVRFAELRRIDHAYVVFNHDYYAALQVIQPFLEQHQIISCGRYGGWNYSSMEDALMFGREAATRARALAG
jgi:protoporphyrinogen oxidase